MNTIEKCRYGLMIYNTNDQTTGKALNLYGEYSEHEVELFRHIVNKDDVIIEVGSNIGVHTVPLAQLVGKGGFIYGYEPEVNNYYCLCGNIALNNLHNVQVFQMAIGKEKGTAKIPQINYDVKYNSGGVVVGEQSMTGIHDIVPLMTLDSFEYKKCDFLKIDVEGMEFDVLCGAFQLLCKFNPLVYVEYHSKKEFENVVNLMNSINYNCYVHITNYYNKNNYKNNLINQIVSDKYELASCMIFCMHKTKKLDFDPVVKFNMKKVESINIYDSLNIVMSNNN